MPYPTYGAYVLLTQQTPPSSPTFVAVPIDHEDSWQNAGYTVQWWLFAAMALFAFVWQARKEAQGDTPEGPRPASGPRPKPTGDRVEEADRRAAERAARAAVADRRAAGDRVAEADRRAAPTAAAPEPDGRASD
jgi:hypothetical protein